MPNDFVRQLYVHHTQVYTQMSVSATTNKVTMQQAMWSKGTQKTTSPWIISMKNLYQPHSICSLAGNGILCNF